MKTYCLRCKQKQEMLDQIDSAFKNGTPIWEGKCAVCGSKLFAIKPRENRAENKTLTQP